MAEEEKTKARLEIAHVLFMDIIGYSKLLMDEQSEALHELNRIVRGTEAVQEAEAAGQLIRLPTGDGMALVFTSSVEAPVECALQVSQALRAQPSLPLRMGVHSGPVQHVKDVNGRENVTGTGINIAQRVMDCGDAGHILVSKRVADDLAASRHWQPYLHELGDCEVKHGVIVSLFNLYAEILGNPDAPVRFAGATAAHTKFVRGNTAQTSSNPRRATGIWLLLVVAAAGAFALWQWRITGRQVVPAIHPPAATQLQPAFAPAAAEISEKSIAVLPFENLSADKDNAFFTDGVQDEILTDLANVADLKVISRTSVMQYKNAANRNLREIGRVLGVAHVLEGSVQRAGNKIRVTAQLIDARTDAHQWAEHYDRPLDDVFAIQSDIAEAIVGQLQARLSPREKSALDARPTTDLAAYDLYLRAKNLYAEFTQVGGAKERFSETTQLLDEAVARDPKFARAWCLLALVHCLAYFQGVDHMPARLEQAHAALEKAVALQPDAGETHLAQAYYYYHGFRDYGHALAELDLARQTLPSAEVYEYSGYIKRRQGHWAESTRDLEHSLELDPRNFFLLQQMASSYEQLHRYADETAILNRALTIVPGDPSTRINLAGVALEARADIKPFQTTLAALLAENPAAGPDVDDPDSALCERTPAAAARALADYPRDGVASNGTLWPHAYWEGVVARWEGDAPRARTTFTAARAEVEKALAAQPNLPMAVSLLGLIDAGLGNREQAIAEGRRACALLPVSQDAMDGPAMAINLAQIYAWTGEKTAALDQIEIVEKAPNTLSYGVLKLDPQWDDLRGDPRFEALVASLAPKQDR